MHKRDDNKSSMFVPMIENDDSYLITKADALSIVHRIIIDETMSESRYIEFENNYNLLAQKDLYKRVVVHEEKEKASLVEKNLEEKSNDKVYKAMIKVVDDCKKPLEAKPKDCIGFDCLAMAFMDMYIDDRVKELEKVYITLKVQNSSRFESRIIYDDFIHSVFFLCLVKT